MIRPFSTFSVIHLPSLLGCRKMQPADLDFRKHFEVDHLLYLIISPGKLLSGGKHFRAFSDNKHLLWHTCHRFTTTRLSEGQFKLLISTNRLLSYYFRSLKTARGSLQFWLKKKKSQLLLVIFQVVGITATCQQLWRVAEFRSSCVPTDKLALSGRDTDVPSFQPHSKCQCC